LSACGSLLALRPGMCVFSASRISALNTRVPGRFRCGWLFRNRRWSASQSRDFQIREDGECCALGSAVTWGSHVIGSSGGLAAGRARFQPLWRLNSDSWAFRAATETCLGIPEEAHLPVLRRGHEARAARKTLVTFLVKAGLRSFKVRHFAKSPPTPSSRLNTCVILASSLTTRNQCT
jgi:hypothetical protein